MYTTTEGAIASIVNKQCHYHAQAQPNHRHADALLEYRVCRTYRKSSSGFPCRSGPVLTVTVLSSDSSFDFTQSLLSVSSQVLQLYVYIYIYAHIKSE
jgi:hypothetical protein